MKEKQDISKITPGTKIRVTYGEFTYTGVVRDGMDQTGNLKNKGVLWMVYDGKNHIGEDGLLDVPYSSLSFPIFAEPVHQLGDFEVI